MNEETKNMMAQILAELNNLREEFRRANEANNKAIICTKEILTADETAEYLGFERRTVMNMGSMHVLPNYKQGARRYFKREELDKWMTANKVPSNDEIDAENSAFWLNKIGRRI